MACRFIMSVLSLICKSINICLNQRLHIFITITQPIILIFKLTLGIIRIDLNNLPKWQGTAVHCCIHSIQQTYTHALKFDVAIWPLGKFVHWETVYCSLIQICNLRCWTGWGKVEQLVISVTNLSNKYFQKISNTSLKGTYMTHQIVSGLDK